VAVLVGVDLPGVLGQEVRAWAEQEAGWQVVGGTGPPAPLLTLARSPVPGRVSVVVVAGPPAPDLVREALLAGALDVVGWPGERDRLLDAPARVPRAVPPGAGPAVVPVAGLAGGVGTSTLALTIGAVLAWSGHQTVVVGGEDLLALCGMGPWTGPDADDLATLEPASAADEVPALARPLPGVPRLTVLAGDPTSLPSVAGWPTGAVVLDLRALPPRAPAGAEGAAALAAPALPATASPGATGRPRGGPLGVVVGRADAGLRRPRRVPPGWRVVAVGGGPLDRPAVTRLLGAPPHAWLPSSERVARAGAAGRVPAGLPGTFVAAVRAALLGPRRVR